MSNLQIEDVYSFEGMFEKEDIVFCSSLPNQNSLAKIYANAPRRSRSTSDLYLTQQESQTGSQTVKDNSTNSLLSKLRKIVNTKKGTKSYLTIPLLNEANHIIDLIETNINDLSSQVTHKPIDVVVAQACAPRVLKAHSPEQIDATIQTSPSFNRSGPNIAKKIICGSPQRPYPETTTNSHSPLS
ncbi:hypothetical protein AVEN_8761-1 [Araneus ventricosus]|uniref:Uncharacterized protein n=1 Tax=Araneus ventricosus TaxID=182803 RepID=A0A4Y2SXT4_ARAVE|nr:hypothetical protein AVEN_8761-1 [Araneus ventricosus]